MSNRSSNRNDIITPDLTVDQAAALAWITRLLAERHIPFQAVGGLAARAWGATRPLADLDFYVPTARLAEIAGVIAGSGAAHIIREPESYRDASWDLTFLAIDHRGQKIELGGADGAKYFDRGVHCWRDAAIDFEASVPRSLNGIEFPVMPLADLVAYKRALHRPVDLLDLAELAGETGPEPSRD